jgi:RimJ/RimL family protein N-acetyltransferase
MDEEQFRGVEMDTGNIFHGKLVRLVAEPTDTIVDRFYRWGRDSEYWRLLNADPVMPYTRAQIKEFVDKELVGDNPNMFFFMIRSLDDDRVIGEVGLDGVDWVHGDTFVGISIGEKDLWGRGYGTDAMQIILRYAFTELNLERVTLTVFEYNPRAIRSYQKAGFKVEGSLKKMLLRGGRRWDEIFMGVLRREWELLKE